MSALKTGNPLDALNNKDVETATIVPITSPSGNDYDDVAAQKAKVHDLETMLTEAEAATESEHRMGLWKAMTLYPKASAWSLALSFAVVMEGFDVILVGSFYAYPSFRNRFGIPANDGTYQIPANWQAGIGGASGVGGIVGILINGVIAEKYGYRKVYCGAMVLITCIIFMFFFLQSLPMLVVAQFLAGIPWGIFQTLTTSYASEVAPVALRGYLTTWVNACWGIGQLLSLGVLRGLLNRNDDWGWRIPYALQWIWPVPLAIIAFLAPESPWWLVRKGRLEDAKKSLKRLTSNPKNDDDLNLDNTISMMAHTIHLEKELTAGASYIDCFRGFDLRRTEIVLGAWAVQQLCGSAFMSYSTYFFQQAGLPVESSFDLSMGQYAINTGGTFICWALMTGKVGRRTLYLWGCVWMCIMLILIGGIGEIGTTSAAWAGGALLLMWSVSYQFTVGTVCYSLICEISSRRLLIKTVNLGRGFYNVIGIVVGTIMGYMLNPTAWNWKSRAAFFWAGFSFLCIVWIYFRLPEPTGLTFAEIDKLFEQKVSARQFRKVGVDTFGKDKAKVAAVKQTINTKLQTEEKHIERAF